MEVVILKEEKNMNNNKNMQVMSLRFKIFNAKNKLKEKDYIGRKIAEVLLVGTPSEIEAIKKEYSAEIAEARLLRENINIWEFEVSQLTEEIKKEQEEARARIMARLNKTKE